MQNYPGYIIPENPQPEGFICLKIFIPAADEYLYAFSGAYQFFGKWLAWERDNAHRGTLAAQSWRDAIDYTYQNGWLNCGENDVCNCQDEINEIIARLEEIENMNINVNCGGCGCGNSQKTPTECYPEGAVEDDVDLPVDPGDDEQIPLSQQAQCNAANYVATTLRNTLIYLAQQGAGYGAFKEYWVAQWNVLPTPPTPPPFGGWGFFIACTPFVDISGLWGSLHNKMGCMFFPTQTLLPSFAARGTFS